MTTTTSRHPESSPPRPSSRRPALGFVGVGWIGRSRLDALVERGVATVAAVADPSEEALASLRSRYPDATFGTTLPDLLAADLDGVVIASPSALHAEQARAALDRGLPVFCQKPLGRTAAEVRGVVDAARAADRLLGVDMSYRQTAAMLALRERIGAGDIGDVYAAELKFHNAYGPDKEWFYDPARSGGGCVMDLGIHLVDLALWMMGGPVERVAAALFAGGRRLDAAADAGSDAADAGAGAADAGAGAADAGAGAADAGAGAVTGGRAAPPVEDYADIRLDLEGGRTARLTCSWNLHAGRDAVIEARFHGTEGGAAVLNVDGSFYDFRAELYHGTVAETLIEPPDAWGGRAALAWARRMWEDVSFDDAAEELVTVAEVLDRIYGR